MFHNNKHTTVSTTHSLYVAIDVIMVIPDFVLKVRHTIAISVHLIMLKYTVCERISKRLNNKTSDLILIHVVK